MFTVGNHVRPASEMMPLTPDTAKHRADVPVDSCSTVPTDGVATMADHWCMTHDAPAHHTHGCDFRYATMAWGPR